MVLSRRLAVIALGIVLLIAYGSLYPFHFVARAVPGGVFSALWRTRFYAYGRSDGISNFVFYLPLGLCVTRAFRKHWLGAIGAIAFGGALSTSMEIAQFFDPGRVPAMGDVYANLAGTVAGAILALALPRAVRDPFAWLLLGCWIGYEIFAPFHWMTQVALLLILVGLWQRGRLAGIAAALAIAFVIFDTLRPFEFHDTGRSFGWMPFASFLDAPRETVVWVAFEKTFLYGAMTWLPARAGMQLWMAAAIAITLEFALRYAQIYLPGRSAEITDAVMVAILAGLQWLLREPPSRPSPYPPSAAPAIPQ